MTDLVEMYATSVGWDIAETNVLVEGTMDVSYLKHASLLHAQAHGIQVIDSDFAIIASGEGDDGGVHGVNRALIGIRQNIDATVMSGGKRHRFVGMYDNDYAGRNAYNLMPLTDTRIRPFVDVFLLQPVMPPVGNGLTDRQLAATGLNMGYRGMDWEVEDLCSQRILEEFERRHPAAVVHRVAMKDRLHRDINRSAKPELIRLFKETATVDDARDMLALMKLLRGYLGVAYGDIRA